MSLSEVMELSVCSPVAVKTTGKLGKQLGGNGERGAAVTLIRPRNCLLAGLVTFERPIPTPEIIMEAIRTRKEKAGGEDKEIKKSLSRRAAPCHYIELSLGRVDGPFC